MTANRPGRDADQTLGVPTTSLGMMATVHGGPSEGARTEAAGAYGASVGGERGEVGELARGDLVGRYVVLSLLGRGGMGIVYAAYDPELDRKVALKLLLTRRSDGGEARVRMLREGQAMAQLSHPNVVAVHDVGTLGDQVFIAMEFIEGDTLTQWLAQRRRNWREILHAFLQAGEGLGRAHAVGLVHRDFKPDNVMIGVDGRVRVTDFGLARAERSTSPRESPVLAVGRASASLDMVVTEVGSLLGTPQFMAPEQWHGADTDGRTDQFSFCVALWSALYGALPFQRPSIAELAIAVTEGRIGAPPRGAKVPGSLHRVLVRGLSVEPRRRFASMDELLRALAQAQARTSKRRVQAGFAALALTAVSAGLFYQYDRAQRQAACEAAGAAIAAVWNDDARTSLRDSLTATHVNYATTTYEKATPWIDRWTQQWSETRARVCVETEVEGTRTPELAALATACLGERRDELAALLAILGEADASTVASAVPAVAGLSPLGPCVDRAALERRPPLPSDLADLDRVQSLRRDLMRVRGLLASGRYVEGLARAERLLGLALAIGHAPLVAEARAAVGHMGYEVGQIETAERSLTRAYVDAGVMGADELAATAAVDLARVVGYLGQHQREGLQWARSAEMLVGRLGQSQQILGANLLNNIGIIHATHGAHEEALSAFERALAIRTELLGADHPSVGDSLSNLGELHRYAGEYDKAEALDREALARREAVLGPDHPDTAASLNNLAAALQDRGDHGEALPLLERALAVWEKSLGADHPNVAHALTNIGHAYAGRRDYAQAVEYLERSLELWKRALGPEHPNYALALSSLALTRYLQRDTQAKEMFEQVLALQRRTLGPEHPEVALTLTYLGQAYAAEGAYERARPLYEQALATWRTSLGLDHPRATHTWIALGELLIAEGRAGEALPLLERALAVLERGGANPITLAKARFALARALRDAPGAARDEARARRLASEAADAYRLAGESLAQELAPVEAWLRTTAGRPE